MALERRLLYIKCNPLTRNAAENDLCPGASRECHGDPVSSIGPATSTLPDSFGAPVQHAGGPIELRPAQRTVIVWRDIDHGSIGQSVGAELTIHRIGCPHSRGCCEQRA